MESSPKESRSSFSPTRRWCRVGNFAGRFVLVWLLVAAVTSSIGLQTASADHGCDPLADPLCQEPYVPDYCDPWVEPSCIPDTTIPIYESGPIHKPGPTNEPPPPYCDPTYDATCLPDPCAPTYDATCDLPYLEDLPYFDNATLCDEILDPRCPDSLALPIPSAVAFADATQSLLSVATRNDPTDDLAVDGIPYDELAPLAASRLVLGLDALAELGAFHRVANPEINDLVRNIRDQVPASGLTEDGYRSEVERLAEDLPLFIDQLEVGGFEVSDEVLDVSDALDDDTVQAILDGDTSLLDPDTWIAALADLSIRGGSAPIEPETRDDDQAAVLGIALLFSSPVADPGAGADEGAEQAVEDVAEPAAATAITQAPSTTSAPALTPPASVAQTQDSNSPEDSSPLLLIGGALAGLLGLVAFLLIRRRSSAVSAAATAVAEATNHKLSVNDLLDASRRMTGSLDTAEISAIALAETERLVAAEGGLLAMRAGTRLSAVRFTPSGLFRMDALDQSSLRRVTETGSSISTVAVDEPVLVEVPMAMAAVPIVADGTITGAIMVVRVASNPFGRDDIEALEMLAPLVGSALQAAEAHGSATALADVEPMTGLKNRRRLEKDLAGTGGDLVAYIMLDVDHFKNFNDVNGHAAGDEALRLVASTLASAVRPGDVVYRYGGEEFCVLLPGTNADEAKDVAERIRSGVEACKVPGEQNQPNGTITVSIGVADTATKSVADLVERADAALYEAKDAGRNQIVVDLTDD